MNSFSFVFTGPANNSAWDLLGPAITLIFLATLLPVCIIFSLKWHEPLTRRLPFSNYSLNKFVAAAIYLIAGMLVIGMLSRIELVNELFQSIFEIIGANT